MPLGTSRSSKISAKLLASGGISLTINGGFIPSPSQVYLEGILWLFWKTALSTESSFIIISFPKLQVNVSFLKETTISRECTSNPLPVIQASLLLVSFCFMMHCIFVSFHLRARLEGLAAKWAGEPAWCYSPHWYFSGRGCS